MIAKRVEENRLEVEQEDSRMSCRFRSKSWLVTLVLFSLGLAPLGCGDSGTSNSDPETSASAESKSSQTSMNSPAPDSTLDSGNWVTWGGISAVIPEGWVEEPVSNTMRAAQFKLPREKGDREDASVVLTYFGPDQGGSLEMNKQRWASQIEMPDGQSSAEAMKVEKHDVGALTAVTTDLTGTYVGAVQMMNPSAGKHNKPNFRMFNVVITGSSGNHYVKALGPKKTMDKWLPSIEAFYGSAKSK